MNTLKPLSKEFLAVQDKPAIIFFEYAQTFRSRATPGVLVFTSAT